MVCDVCVCRGYGTYIPGGLLFRTREHDFIPPLFPTPPGGHERHNPLRGRERDVAWTRGNAADGVTPGCRAQRPWRRESRVWVGVDRFPADRRAKGRDYATPHGGPEDRLRGQRFRPSSAFGDSA